jgi:hypothetical protein
MSNANKTRCLFKRIRSRLKRRFFFPSHEKDLEYFSNFILLLIHVTPPLILRVVEAFRQW